MASANGNGYLFVALDGADRSVLLNIQAHTDGTHKYLRSVCHKMFQAVKGYHEHRNDVSCPAWAEWDIVSWSQKNVPEREKYAAWAGDVLAGYLWLRMGFPSQHRPGETLAYVEIMAATPSNIPTPIWQRNLRAVGTALLAFAALRSREHGHKGTFGLHGTSEAVDYYRKLNMERGGSLFEPELTGIPGTTERAKTQPYFETKLDGALSLLEDYRHA